MRTIRNKLTMLGIGLLAAGVLFFSPATAYANEIVNPPMPRSQPAPPQQRFNWYYEFESGMDFRFDLGRPTTWNGVVSQDVFTANVRRDANVSLVPPGPRIGNTIIPTDPSNWAFTHFHPQQSLLHQNGFWNPVELENPNAVPRLRLGAARHKFTAPRQSHECSDERTNKRRKPRGKRRILAANLHRRKLMCPHFA